MALKDKYLTISEAAKQIGVTRQTISRWITEHELPVEKIGRETLIEKRVLDRIHFTRIADTFDEAIILTFMEEIREEFHYSPDDEIKLVGDLLFEIKKKDGTLEKVKITGFRVEPTEMEKIPYKKSKKKGKSRE